MKNFKVISLLALVLIAGVTFGGCLLWLRIQDLEAENRSLHDQTSELSKLRAESRELEALQNEAKELPALREQLKEVYQLRADHQEVIRLREALAKAEATHARTVAATPPPLNAIAPEAPATAVVTNSPQQGARLGVAIASVAEQRKTDPNLDEPDGVIVMKVLPDSPAGRSGLREKDVIVAVDNQPVATVADLKQLVSQHNPGELVGLNIVRKGTQMHFLSATEAWPDPGAQQNP
jgi:C-terminal processing protease CtpA/Prc